MGSCLCLFVGVKNSTPIRLSLHSSSDLLPSSEPFLWFTSKIKHSFLEVDIIIVPREVLFIMTCLSDESEHLADLLAEAAL